MRRGQTRSWSSSPRRRALALTLATVAAAILVSGVRGVPEVAAQAGQGTAETSADEQLGAELYGRDCVYCHGVEGEGSPRGIPIADAGEAAAHYALITGRMPLDDADDIPSRGPVRYTDEQLAALVRHVAAFGDGPELPETEWRDADVAAGGQLYRLYCGACHGATAIGGALAYDRVAPGLFESEPSVIAAAVVTGPGAMPAFGDDFTTEELSEIVAYVQRLQQRDDPGGWSIFRTGRPDEALVALGLAMPVLLAGAGWLARRPRGDAG